LSSKDLKKVPEIRVFNKWPTAGIEAVDLGLKRYIALRPSLVPHTNGPARASTIPQVHDSILLNDLSTI